jgi:hypothetical protein
MQNRILSLQTLQGSIMSLQGFIMSLYYEYPWLLTERHIVVDLRPAFDLVPDPRFCL